MSFTARAQECSIKYQKLAETAVGSLPSWTAVNTAYQRFGHCDDGSIGEGFSESITNLLSDNWGNLKPLISFAKKDSGFEAFIYKHIDSSVPIYRLRKIQANSENNCPKLQKALCNEIAARARRAIATAN
jgi:hypothetical protein